jgi:dipeptidyl aminopeptidase/acylaminoacyl peptidase
VAIVVERAVADDLLIDRGDSVAPSMMLGAVISPDADPGTSEYRRAREASPITHVTPDDPPFYLVHGDADDVVHIAQSEVMEEALRAAGVPCQFRRVPGGVHGPGLLADSALRDEVRAWFNEHLRGISSDE